MSLQTQNVKLLVSSSTYFEAMTWNMNVVCYLRNNTVSKSSITKFQNVLFERDLGDQWLWNSTFTYEKIGSWISLRRNNSLTVVLNLVTELISIRTRIKTQVSEHLPLCFFHCVMSTPKTEELFYPSLYMFV